MGSDEDRQPIATPYLRLLQTVYGYFNKWREQGIFEQVQQALTRRERKRRDVSLPHQQADFQDSNTRKIKRL